MTFAIEKYTKNGGEPVLSVSSETSCISINHALTEDIEPGLYDAEIELKMWNGEIHTVYPATKSLTDRQARGLEAWNNLLVRREVVKPDANE